jgi:hypothetical protein
MKKQLEENPPPNPADLEGWRKAIASNQLASFRLEAIVAALQDLADSPVRDALAKHLSGSTIKMLRRYIGTNHPNQGEDIILRVHGDIFEAVLEKDSADGKGLREAFGPRVQFRAKDAIATEKRHSQIPLMPKVREVRENEDEDDVETDLVSAGSVARLVARSGPVEPADDEVAPSQTSHPDFTLLVDVRHADECIDVECVLANINDYRKRLAFRLFMDDIPLKSNRSESIAEAVGVSDKTARAWIEELKHLLEGTEEVKELQGRKVGEST